MFEKNAWTQDKFYAKSKSNISSAAQNVISLAGKTDFNKVTSGTAKNADKIIFDNITNISQDQYCTSTLQMEYRSNVLEENVKLKIRGVFGERCLNAEFC